MLVSTNKQSILEYLNRSTLESWHNTWILELLNDRSALVSWHNTTNSETNKLRINKHWLVSDCPFKQTNKQVWTINRWISNQLKEINEHWSGSQFEQTNLLKSYWELVGTMNIVGITSSSETSDGWRREIDRVLSCVFRCCLNVGQVSGAPIPLGDTGRNMPVWNVMMDRSNWNIQIETLCFWNLVKILIPNNFLLNSVPTCTSLFRKVL